MASVKYEIMLLANSKLIHPYTRLISKTRFHLQRLEHIAYQVCESRMLMYELSLKKYLTLHIGDKRQCSLKLTRPTKLNFKRSIDFEISLLI